MIDLVIGILGILIAILTPLIAFIYNRRRKLKAYYEIMWKKSSRLKPDRVLGIRGESRFGFHEYYYQRPIDEVIRKEIEKDQNVLIIGDPLAG